MPEWLEPMAATLTQERFAGPEWLFERKYDGIRLLAYQAGRRASVCYSRNRLPQNCPPVAEAIAELAGAGRDSGRGDRGTAGRYHVFDIMWLDGAT